jgi:hypothetical protein
MKLCARLLAFLCLAIAVLTTLASGTQIFHLSPQELGKQSELVVRGRVIGVQSYWNDKHTKIFTRTRIGVDETYKGLGRSAVDVIQLGGVVGNIKVTVHGASHWEVGEEVLLFAEPYDTGSFQVSGFSQGKLRILRDPETGLPYVQASSMEGVRVLQAPPGREPAAATMVQKVPLEEFLNQALGRR